MNLKFSQFPRVNNIKDNDIIPILRDNNNYALSGLSIYNYLSGNNIKDLYTSYNMYSSLFLSTNDVSNSLFSTYSKNSAFYVTTNTTQNIAGIKTFLNQTNFNNSLTAVVIYTPSGNSVQWNQTSTYVAANSSNFTSTFNTVCALSGNWNNTYNITSQISGKVIVSDTTYYPTATALKNIIAISQNTYDNLVILDPYTLYIVY
jgi:hypothetical protein